MQQRLRKTIGAGGHHAPVVQRTFVAMTRWLIPGGAVNLSAFLTHAADVRWPMGDEEERRAEAGLIYDPV